MLKASRGMRLLFAVRQQKSIAPSTLDPNYPVLAQISPIRYVWKSLYILEIYLCEQFDHNKQKETTEKNTWQRVEL